MEIDLRDPDSIREAVELLEESKVYPSRIVANASARGALGPEFDELTHSEFTHLFEVDVTGHMLLARELRSVVPNQNIASVVFMSSIYAIQGVDDRIYPVDMPPTPIHYSTVKSAMEGLARSLATKWRTTTRVNVVIAGGVRSTDRQNKEFVDEYSEKTLIGRLSEPAEIADAVYFLSSDTASYITGHSLIVDGGYSVW